MYLALPHMTKEEQELEDRHIFRLAVHRQKLADEQHVQHVQRQELEELFKDNRRSANDFAQNPVNVEPGIQSNSSQWGTPSSRSVDASDGPTKSNMNPSTPQGHVDVRLADPSPWSKTALGSIGFGPGVQRQNASDPAALQATERSDFGGCASDFSDIVTLSPPHAPHEAVPKFGLAMQHSSATSAHSGSVVTIIYDKGKAPNEAERRQSSEIKGCFNRTFSFAVGLGHICPLTPVGEQPQIVRLFKKMFDETYAHYKHINSSQMETWLIKHIKSCVGSTRPKRHRFKLVKSDVEGGEPKKVKIQLQPAYQEAKQKKELRKNKEIAFVPVTRNNPSVPATSATVVQALQTTGPSAFTKVTPIDLDAHADLSDKVDCVENEVVGMADRGLINDGESPETHSEMIAACVVRSFMLLYFSRVIFFALTCT
jgi:hypothetical protein